MKRIVGFQTVVFLVVVIMVLYISLVIAQEMTFSTFEFCHEAFGPDWYPVHNVEGATCRHMNGTTRPVHLRGTA